MKLSHIEASSEVVVWLRSLPKVQEAGLKYFASGASKRSEAVSSANNMALVVFVFFTNQGMSTRTNTWRTGWNKEDLRTQSGHTWNES
jgi:hypothetical protein